MTHTFSIGEAKTQLSKLVAMAERGEQVELRRNRTPVARLVPVAPAGARREPGALSGRIRLGPDFDSLPVDVAQALGIRD